LLHLQRVSCPPPENLEPNIPVPALVIAGPAPADKRNRDLIANANPLVPKFAFKDGPPAARGRRDRNHLTGFGAQEQPRSSEPPSRGELQYAPLHGVAFPEVDPPGFADAFADC
jgi:hypothetical protein